MDTATRVQYLKEADYISFCANTLEKDMNQFILPLTIAEKSELSNLSKATNRGKKTSESKSVKLRLKIELVSYLARAERLNKFV